MRYIIIIVLLVCLWNYRKRVQKTEQKAEELQQELSKMQTVCGTVWDCANTIHLYAALSEEECSSEQLKEKQTEIMKMSEEVMHLVQK